MKGEIRKEAITAAVMPVFARKGFDAVTTKELAQAAGVSEALLYKHFPSKHALYKCIAECRLRAQRTPDVERFLAMPASTEKLVFGIAGAIRLALRHPDEFSMLVCRSLLSDGEFAHRFLVDNWGNVIPMFEASYEAARKAGDLQEPLLPGKLMLWLPQHLANALRFYSFPKKPPVDYGVGREELESAAILFSLRGVGLKPEALRRYRKTLEEAGRN